MARVLIGNIKGPKGDKGDIGATGPQGPVGAQGPQGLPGKDGTAALNHPTFVGDLDECTVIGCYWTNFTNDTNAPYTSGYGYIEVSASGGSRLQNYIDILIMVYRSITCVIMSTANGTLGQKVT